MTTITIDRAVVEQALHVAESAGYPVALIKALRAALAQQDEPVQEPAFHGFMSDDGTQVDVCFSPSAPRRDGTYATAYYTAPPQQVAQQAEPLNLSDPAVQKRLASQWGYVPAAQESVPAAVVGTQSDVWRGYNGQWQAPGEPIKTVQMLRDLPMGTLLYTAPPQRKPLTEGEIDGLVIQHAGYGRDNFYAVARAVERAHGIKE